jgi:hypothetical protein
MGSADAIKIDEILDEMIERKNWLVCAKDHLDGG